MWPAPFVHNRLRLKHSVRSAVERDNRDKQRRTYQRTLDTEEQVRPEYQNSTTRRTSYLRWVNVGGERSYDLHARLVDSASDVSDLALERVMVELP